MGGGIGGLLNVKQSGQNYSYLYDGKGNVTAVIDSAEATAATYTYDAFGNLMVKTGSLDQPFQFSTKRYDTQTGLVYYGYRFYSPVSGRWITRDPLGESGGINLYGFTGNSPINWVDLWGLYWQYSQSTGGLFP
jgi:RHS repeat-associated protein